MSILCKLFGHTPAIGYGRGPQYGEVWGSEVDGIGREHLYLKYRCRRCSDSIYLNIHVPEKK